MSVAPGRQKEITVIICESGDMMKGPGQSAASEADRRSRTQWIRVRRAFRILREMLNPAAV